MNIGYVDFVRFTAIENYIKKILSLKKKYDFSESIINIDYDTKIKFDDENGVCYILIGSTRVIKYSYHHSLNMTKIILTAGIHNNVVCFATNDKKFRNKKTIKTIEEKLEKAIPTIENYMRSKSKLGILDNVHIQINNIETLRSKYDIKPVNGEKLTIPIDDKITLEYIIGEELKKIAFVTFTAPAWFVLVNGNKVIGWSFRLWSDGSVKFLTSNSDVNTREFADKIAKKIKDVMPRIEEDFKSTSNEKFRID